MIGNQHTKEGKLVALPNGGMPYWQEREMASKSARVGEKGAGNAETHTPGVLVSLKCVVLNSCTLGSNRLILLVAVSSLDV